MNSLTLKPIARMHGDFPEKFGIPRQSGMVGALEGTLVFEPEYRVAQAFRGLEAFSHLWLIWGFSQSLKEGWAPTVRPPRLGGNKRMGVFATRSPFRPNPLGLSCVALEGVEHHPSLGPVLHIKGADLMDGTPVYDIKPYLPYTDCYPQATGGFTGQVSQVLLQVDIAPQWQEAVPTDKLEALISVLAQDPRPAYQRDPQRVYGMAFAGLQVKFTVGQGRLTVVSIQKIQRR